MMADCPICGKKFVVHWPELWNRKRGPTYYCSWQCYDVSLTRDKQLLDDVMRKKRKDLITMKYNKRVTREQKEKAVQISTTGGDPVAYLDSCGIADAKKCWNKIKSRLRQIDPEQGAKIPDFRGKTMTAKEPKTAGDAMVAMKEAADTFFGQCEDMGLKLDTPKPIDGGECEKIETPESNKLKVAVIGKPETAGELKRETRYTVTAIKYPEIGEFYYDRKYNSIDWRTPEGDEVSMSPTAWKILQHDLKEIMTVLGVEL